MRAAMMTYGEASVTKQGYLDKVVDEYGSYGGSKKRR